MMGNQGFKDRMSWLKRKDELEQGQCLKHVVRTGTLKAPDVTSWYYEVLDGVQVRIIFCETTLWELEIPSTIEGLPVKQIADRSCTQLDSVVRIICPSNISEIGAGAFRLCSNLVAIDLPDELDMFDRSWLEGCDKLSDIRMPGHLELLDSRALEGLSLAKLRLGSATSKIIPDAFASMHISKVAIDPRNWHLSTDGRAIYSDGGQTLDALAAYAREYDIASNCRHIADRAFIDHEELETVGFPPSLETIGASAFAGSGIKSFVAPHSLKSIGDRAFEHCGDLRYASLNDGLESMGDMAFDSTGLVTLEIPEATVDSAGKPASNIEMGFEQSELSGDSENNGGIEVDSEGGLYREKPDGRHLVRLMDNTAKRYVVADGTRFVDDKAFMRHATLEEVVLPEGLEAIGNSAFLGCHGLEWVNLPETLHSIGAEAFYDTMADHLRLPAGLKDIGDAALATSGALVDGTAPSLRDLSVDPANPKFTVRGPLLLECIEHEPAERYDPQLHNGKLVLYLGTSDIVNVPKGVTEIAPYAFSGARNLRDITFSEHLGSIGDAAFEVDCIVEHVHIDLDEPVEGRTSLDLNFPKTPRSKHEFKLAFGRSNHLDLQSIMRHYDDAIIHMLDGQIENASNQRVDSGRGVYRQAKGMIARLKDPVLMDGLARNLMERTIEDDLIDICIAIARHDDREALSDLADLGYLDESTLLKAIDAVSRLGDAAITGYLLQMRRQRYGDRKIDLDL